MAADVSGLRSDARAARDELWAWALTTSPSSDRMREHAETADALLDEAEALVAAGDVEGARMRFVRVTQLADDRLAETLLEALIRRQPLRVRRLRFGA
jgi:hypothetical protein